MRVIVLGGGYAGLSFLKRLMRTPLDPTPHVLFVDRLAVHTFKTQLHRLAAGTAEARDVTVPYPHAAYLCFRQGEVERLHPAERAAVVDGRRLEADVLVVALGSEVQTFGVPGVEDHALSLEGLREAAAARGRIAALGAGQRLVVVGAGLTGVELATEVREARPDVAVTVLEAAPSPVPAFPEHVRTYVEGTLRGIGVDLRCGQAVGAVLPGALRLGADEVLAADAIVWAAGVRPPAAVRDAGFTLGRGQRVEVDACCEAGGFPGVFVLGDSALAPQPPSARVAEYQGTVAAKAVAARSAGKPFRPAPLRLEGVVASLGTREGFSTILRRELVGGPARQLKTVVEWLYKWRARH